MRPLNTSDRLVSARPSGLDRHDIAILAALCRDAGQSNGRIGEAVALSHSAVARRIQAMRASGVLKGSHANIDWPKLGFPIRAVALVRRSRAVPKEKVWSFLRRQPSVVSCRLVTGPHDLVLEIVARSLDDYGQFVSDELLGDAGIETIESLMVLTDIKDGPIELQKIVG
jgi:DNA-binding Lrp family transcriptional regulator